MVQLAEGWRELWESFAASRLWLALAMNDIRGRYRGSLLGPFWITLTTSAFVGGIGLLYAGIMRVSLQEYLPYLATGVVIWNLIASALTEAGDTFVIASGILKQTAVSPLVFVWRTIVRVLVNFGHEALVIIVVLALFGYVGRTRYLELPLGFLLVVLNLSWLVCLIAVYAARFRDIPQVVRAAVQLVFFVSPVIWLPGSSRTAAAVVGWNPVYYMLDVTRSPLLGHAPQPNSFVVLTLFALAGWLTTFLVYSTSRRGIVIYV